MTIKKLIRKLQTVPEDYEATVYITHAVIAGTYEVDDISIDDDCKQVELSSKHKCVWDWEKGKWEK